MTNWHVFEQAADAAYSTLDFDYEVDLNGLERQAIHFRLEPTRLFYSNKDLDFAIVAVEGQSQDGSVSLARYGWLPLSGDPGKSQPGEYLTIIQHPGGEMKQVCVRENKLLKYADQTVWYMTDTVGGSSGSPVFNGFWQVVALHHSGVPRKDDKGNWLTKDGKIYDTSMDESAVDWIANEGIRVSAIVNHLRTKLGNDHWVRTVLNAPVVSAPESDSPQRGTPRARALSNANGIWAENDGNTVSLVVPLRIPLELVRVETAMTAPTPSTATTSMLTSRPADDDSSLIEKVNIDQTTLGTRPGYKPDFLGTGKLSVPLPKIPASLKSQVATLIKKPSQNELKYFNYSTVMNKKRKLAFFSAVNIDGNLRRDVGKRAGDTWFRDPRILDTVQIGNEFYQHQAEQEQRENNPFDRGHLVRRLDATWGTSIPEAKTHGDDTFHFTNCAPQFWEFNQGKTLWAGIEDFVLSQLEVSKRKACVINGPVFDGPLAESGAVHPDPKRPAKEDPKFKEVSIPKFFWKVMVVANGAQLAVSAFLLSQQEQVFAISRIEELTATQAAVFQVSLADITALTKLDFGSLASADTKEAARGPRRLERLEDIRITGL